MLRLINLKHLQQASPSRPKIFRYPPWERTLTSVWAVKHTMSCRNIKKSDNLIDLLKWCITCWLKSALPAAPVSWQCEHGSFRFHTDQWFLQNLAGKDPQRASEDSACNTHAHFTPRSGKKRLMPITTSNWLTNRKFQLTCKRHWEAKAA